MHLSDSELRDAAIYFTEHMRADFERSFGFREFKVFLTVVYGAEMTIDQEGLMLKHFDQHYDLSRSPIGGPRWSFIPEK
jgi:hypothetical protein